MNRRTLGVAVGAVLGGALGTAAAILVPGPSGSKLAAAEEEIVTSAEPAVTPELLVGVVAVSLVVLLILSFPRRWSADGD